MSMFGSSGGDSSEEEELQAAALVASMGRKHRWGGSVFGHRTYKRDRDAAERLLMQEYFDEEPIYDEDQFRRRYWVVCFLLLQPISLPKIILHLSCDHCLCNVC